MIPQYWSWILTAVGVTGLYLAGSKKTAGWVIGIIAQLLWVTYGVSTEQYGFIFSSFAYGAVNIRNLLRWRRENASPSTLFREALDEQTMRQMGDAMEAARRRHVDGSPCLVTTQPQAVEADVGDLQHDWPPCRFPACGRACLRRCAS